MFLFEITEDHHSISFKLLYAEEVERREIK